jgi:predicted PurR-regulated permease PerM
MLANAQKSADFARQFFARLIPGSGDNFVTLSEQTIRSVAAGVIGVALIQGALIGLGLVVMEVPGAPILIIAVVLLGIVQLPATLVTIPIIIWAWATRDPLPAVLFTIYIVPAGLADNVLKPLLLGRGVEAPMLVIFIGAIGGFILSGIIGLFVGAVVLVLAYKLFEAWLAGDADASDPNASSGAAEEAR